MANAQSNVTVNISANTGDLDAKLAKQEAAIKTLDGAINVLGGSVELAASAIVATGIASEETAKNFESTALAAIAFADGSKRVLDGVKSLNEGLKAYGGVSKAAAAAQKALNASVLANPYVLAAAAVVALGSALAVLYNRQVEAEEAEKSGTAALEKQAEATEKLKKETDELRESLSEYQATLGAGAAAANRDLKLLQAQGASEEELREARKKAVNERIRDLNRQLGFVGGNAKLEEEINQKKLDAQNELDVIDAEYNTKKRDRDAKRREQEQKDFDAFLKEQNRRNEEYDKETKELARQLAKRQEERDKAAIKQGQRERQVRQQLTYDSIKLQQDQANFDEKYNKKIESNFVLRLKNSSAELNDFFESEAAASISAGLGIATQFTNLLLQTQDDSTEEAFEASKKYKIAQVVTSAAQSSFEAFASAQKLNATVPGLGTLLGVALVTAIGAASTKAIADINSATFQQSGGSISTPSSANINLGGAIPGATQQGGFLALAPPTTSAPPIRAYVVTGDVTDGIEAEQQLQTRRQFGPG